MRFSAMSINVGGGRANRQLVMQVFSFVDVLFVVDPPAGDEGSFVEAECGDRILFSFVVGSGVEVWVRAGLAGSFSVVDHNAVGAMVGYVYKGVRKVVGGVYLRPGKMRNEFTGNVGPFSASDTIIGDFNARHTDWCVATNTYGWALRLWAAEEAFAICRPDAPMFDGVSSIDLCLTKTECHTSYWCDAGLPHTGVLVRLSGEYPDDVERIRTAWKKVDMGELAGKLAGLEGVADGDIWGKVVDIVGRLPKQRCSRLSTGFWTADLERMRKDVKRLRHLCALDPTYRETFNLARKVYRSTILRARSDRIAAVLKDGKDPAIFQMIKKLDTRRMLPAMRKENGDMEFSHEGVSEMIAAQLSPVGYEESVPTDIDIEPVEDLNEILGCGPRNTTPGPCDMSYPMLRMWHRTYKDSLLRLLNHGLRHDIEDWHAAEVVLIPKADKPEYCLVKSWRMIHLLPVLAKTAERVMLGRIAGAVALDDTQFGSQRRKGVHDCIALAYEFLEDNKRYHRAFLSVDVEGGFDNVDVDNLSDFMIARGCPNRWVAWTRRWAQRRKLVFRFNGRMSRPFYTRKGIPQGSPLSPYLFGIYIADIFRCRLRYSQGLRSAVLSYVDDGLVLVAGDSKAQCVAAVQEVNEDMVRVARGRGMGFSAIKSSWIGFGGRWDAMELGGVEKFPTDVLRVLGFFFNTANNFVDHVRYWVGRALDVRRRIAAVGRRFGGGDGLGAWEVWRLVQAVFIPTACYGLEMVVGDAKATKTLQVHVNDCLRSTFRAPARLANNILSAEYAVPPVALRGMELRHRCFVRKESYRYGSHLPFFDSLRRGWGAPGLGAHLVQSDKVLTAELLFDLGKDKATAIDMHDDTFHEATGDPDSVIVYTDGSRSDQGCGATWLAYSSRRFGDPRLIKASRGWSITVLELYAIYDALVHMAEKGFNRICVFSDSLGALRQLASMSMQGDLAPVWDAMLPVLNKYRALAFGWSPGHAGIAGNEMADVAAKRAAIDGDPHIGSLNLDGGGKGIIRDMMIQGWKDWHLREGHHYYRRAAGRSSKYLRGCTRLDAYVLLRLRAGIGQMGHDGCDRGEQRFHLQQCLKYA